MYEIHDVVYIPFNPDDREVMEYRLRLRKSFIDDGWQYLGSAKLRDEATGENIHVFILSKL